MQATANEQTIRNIVQEVLTQLTSRNGSTAKVNGSTGPDNRWGVRLSGGYQQARTFDKSRTGLNDLATEYAESGVAASSVNAPAPGGTAFPPPAG